MFHIGIATQHPPLPERGQLSDLGIDFVEKCLDIDPMKRPTAAELMEHEWIVQFSQEIAKEMNSHEGPMGQFLEEDVYQSQEGDEMPTEVLQDIIEEPAGESSSAEQEAYQGEYDQA